MNLYLFFKREREQIRIKLKSGLWIGLLCLVCILAGPASYALDVKDVPNPQQVNGGWVTDMAGMLSPAAESQLNQMISNLEAKNGDEIAIVTVPETKPVSSPKEFATTLFNYWKIGKKGKDNGVLVLVSKGERRTEIETGYGVEGILPDAKVGGIISKEMTPRFKAGDFEGGILAGTRTLIEVLSGGIPLADSFHYQASHKVIPIYVGFLIILGFILVALTIFHCLGALPAYRNRSSYNISTRRRSGGSSSDSGDDGFGGGGSDGGGFGGGDSGGGGAGGSW